MVNKIASIVAFFFALTIAELPSAHNGNSAFGVDVSHHQGTINWEILKRQGVQFAYIKATEGGDFRDSLYDSNIDNARKAGIAAGAYHFFTFCRTARDQVRNFINAVPVSEGDLPPVVDVEFVGNCRSRPGIDTLHRELTFFIDSLRSVYGVDPVVYTTEQFYGRYKLGELKTHFWIRSIGRKPAYSALIWQYGVGKLNGVQKELDFNILNTAVEKLPRVTTVNDQ